MILPNWIFSERGGNKLKLKNLIIMTLMAGILVFIPQKSVQAKEYGFEAEVISNDTYSYSFKLTKAHDVSFTITEEGDSVIKSYVKDSKSKKHPLTFGSNNTATLYLEAGKYSLCIVNKDDYEKYYEVSIDTEAAKNNFSDDEEGEADYEEYLDNQKDNDTGNEDLIKVEEIEFDLSSFDPTEVTVNGETIKSIKVAASDWFTLEVQYVNGGAPSATDIEYSFSNKECISIQDQEYGKFNALKEGDCVVTATYGDVSIKIDVQIYDVKYSIKTKEYSLRYGKTSAVDFVRDDGGYANEVLKATSSDKKVAVYDMNEELIVAKKAGTCNLTFTMKNGQKVTCKVTVPKFTLLENIDSQVAYSSDLSKIYTETINKIKYPYASVFIGNRLKDKKSITYVEYSVYQYDNKGNRVNEADSDFIWNDYIYGGSTIHVYTSVNVMKYHSCLKKVYYEDDTTWTNPYYKEWVTKYKSKY